MKLKELLAHAASLEKMRESENNTNFKQQNPPEQSISKNSNPVSNTRNDNGCSDVSDLKINMQKVRRVGIILCC